MLSSAPSSIDGGHLDASKSQFGDWPKGSGRDTSFDRTDKVVKTVENGSHDYVGNRLSSVVANLQ